MSETHARNRTTGLLLLLLTTTPLSAQPLLHLADTFHGFSGAWQLAYSADGTYLYAGNPSFDLTVLRRDAGGDWSEVAASYRLQSAGDFVISPDQHQIYFPGGSKILVYAREPESGLLTPVQEVVSGDAGVPEFSGASSLVLSPDGEFLYAGLSNSDAQRLLVLARDPAGRLSFVQQLTSPATAFELRLTALLTSPGGEHLYSLGAPAISTFDRDPVTGRLSFAGAMETIAGEDETLVRTSFGASSPDGSTLYVIGQNSCYASCRIEAVAVLRRDPTSGLPELIELAPESIESKLTTLAIDPEGRHLYLPDLEPSHSRIKVFAAAADGRLEPQGELLGRPLRRAQQIVGLALDPGGRELLASGFDERALPRLGRDPATGELSYEGLARGAGEALSLAWDMVASPDGDHLYVSGLGSIAAFAWDDATGDLEPLAAEFGGEPGLQGLDYEVSLAASPDGSRLYAAASGLWSFARSAGGELELAASMALDGAIGSITGLEVSPDGGHLYLLGAFGADVVSRDPASDQMETVQTYGIDIAFRALAFSPDGAFGYALVTIGCYTTGCQPALAIYQRDLDTGWMTLRDTVLGPGPTPFESPRGVVVSADGEQVYVSSIELGFLAITAFSRDGTDGSLTILETVFDDEPVDPGHYALRSLAIAADGRHLYALRVATDSLVVFERDLETGRLTLLESFSAGDLETDGLEVPISVAVSPDSQLVYVTSYTREAVATFSRACLTSATACARGDRFRLDVDWRDHAGRTGTARHLAPAGDTSRLFWFFGEDNWEMMVKVLDGCAFNDHLWVFAAATTDVETRLTVTDTRTGRRRDYASELGSPAPAVTDTAAFPGCDGAGVNDDFGSAPTAAPLAAPPKTNCDGGPGLCVADRFDVRVEWRDYAGNAGAGHLVPLESGSSGVLWFFDPGNWEMMVKVLDGCAFNDRVWVFAAATTDVETRLTVTDRQTGAVRVYDKPLGVAAPAITDTRAFDACGGGD